MRSRQSGFSLIELMVAMAVMLLISGAAITALLKMSTTQATIWNRTQMHSGIRGATEVLQQEVGQAGRVTLPNTVKLGAAVASGSNPVTISCSGTCAANTAAASGMFVGEYLTIDAGCYDTAVPCTSRQEIVQVTACTTTLAAKASGCTSGASESITATFGNAHDSGASVQALGGFSAGIVPPDGTTDPSVNYPNGSSGSVLKLFGDINADGNMVYVEYKCDTGVSGTGNLYRNSMDFSATTKLAPSASQILLSNVTTNPDLSSCFKYQTQSVVINGVTTYFVTDVAVTLTVNTQQVDPVTKRLQTETKALLNVSPRNVYNAWELAGIGVTDSYALQRVQPIPTTVAALLPGNGS